MAGTNSMQKTARDMILSLIVIVLVAGVVWLFLPHEDGDYESKRVDYRVDLLTARRAASYPLAAPEGLSEEWKPTSVRYQGAEADAWHLGFHAPDGEYVAVEQSADKRSAFIEDRTQGATKTDATQRIAGETWTRYEGDHYDALVLEGTEGRRTAGSGRPSAGPWSARPGSVPRR
ncbi:DUF4245 domain-containing protein, partial [Streptomyces sp. NPDC004976]